MAEFTEESGTRYIHPPRKSPWRWLKFVGIAFGALILAELLFLAWIWPDWNAIRIGKIPESTLISDYKELREEDPKLPALRWTPFQKQLPKSVTKVFVFAEDSRFYEHGGIDYQAIREAADYNWKHKKVLLGASTISQQTAKNLFLSLSRNPLRKWHEFLLTYLLEYKLTKGEILHAYLNVAEFGRGIYGLEAAARTYFGTSAHNLSQEQAIQLAATLPSPKKHNPKSATRNFQKRSRRIASAMRVVDQYAAGQGNQAAEKALLELRLQQLKDAAEADKSDRATAETTLSGEELDAAESTPTTVPEPVAVDTAGSESETGTEAEAVEPSEQEPEIPEGTTESEAVPVQEEGNP